MRNEYSKPTTPKDLHFDVFAEIFSGPDSVVRRPDPVDPPQPRDFKIQELSQSDLEANPADATQVRFSSSAKISLSDKAKKALKGAGSVETRVRVTLAWKVLEDGEGGTVDPALSDHSSYEWPSGFTQVSPGVAEGMMGEAFLSFKWRSSFFPDDWQVLPFAKAEIFPLNAGDLA